jgi:hypothetical protein
MVQRIKKKILSLQLILLTLPGCITLPDPEIIISETLSSATQPLMVFTEPLAEAQIEADQLNQFISGVAGPNNISASLLQFQNYNRDVNSAIQNPWETILNYRDMWLQ